MKRAKALAFGCFTAAFAVLAAWVFWGTWSLDAVPVMPDCAVVHPADAVSREVANWLRTFRLIPDDLKILIGGPYFWQELQYAFALFMAACGVVYYCRGRGLSRAASYGAGLLLAFCGYWSTLFSAGHLGWFRWMTYGVFAFGLCDRAVRVGKLRHAIMLGAVVSWAGFNQQDLWLLFTVLTAFYFVWCCVRERCLPWKPALVALAVFVLVGLPNFVSSLGSGVQSRKDQIARSENITQGDASESEKRWEFVTNWSMPPEDTLEFFCPRIYGDTSCPFVLSINGAKGATPYTGALGRPMNAKSGNYRQHSLYVGWMTCLLAIAGVVFGIRRGRAGMRTDVGFFLAAAVICYALSLGRNFAPAYRVIFALPFGDLIRCPVKWHHITEFCLVILAGFGLNGLLSVLRMRSVKPMVANGIVAGLALVGAADLAAHDHIYCAPVNRREARQRGWRSDLSFMHRNEFANPQVQQMVKQGAIKSVAMLAGRQDVYLVDVMRPFEPSAKPEPVGATMKTLGAISILSSLAAILLSAIGAFGDRRLPAVRMRRTF